MKGLGKAIARTPFAVTSKIGMAKKSTDTEYDEYHRSFTALEQGAEKLIKDSKAFSEAVTNLFTSGASFATHFAIIFQPIASEYDLLGKHPDSEQTIRSITKYENAMSELQELIGPELELIESRIIGPAKELQLVMRTIRKTITKRDHKLTDYDRFNNSLTKLRDKKDKSLSDEKNLFKLEQDFEIATNEYEYINTALKQDLPRFLMLSSSFIDPLFNSFFYMQLNIYYLIFEKMNSFADDAKYDIQSMPAAQIAQEYEEKRTDAWQVIENLNIIKRIISVSRMVQATKSGTLNSPSSSLGRQASVATTSSSLSARSAAPVRTPSAAASFKKVAPPPPASSALAAPPPPYSASSSASSAAASKRAPPPPPPLKPKPKPPVPQIKYVVALYDFEAQADGDLSFSAGDKIELVEKTQSTEDWWTGRLNGAQGVFPGNYVQET